MENAQPDSPVSRRGSILASGPLGLIAVAFVMPFADQCGNGHMDYPYQTVSDPFMASWALPPFLIAGLLAALTWVAVVKRRSPGSGAFRVACAGLFGDLAGSVIWLLSFAGKDRSLNQGELTEVLWSSAGILLGVGFAIAAWKQRGWDRWVRVIGAHAAFASHLCWLAIGAKKIGSGGYLFMGSIGLLLLVVGWTLVSRKAGDSVGANRS